MPALRRDGTAVSVVGYLLTDTIRHDFKSLL
jgi:hypothetical protein